VLATLRALLGIRIGVSRADALRIAREHCEVQGWPWNEPVLVSLGLRCYSLFTNANYRGGNVTVRIDAESGTVLSASFAQR
jgi:hypothetical protein